MTDSGSFVMGNPFVKVPKPPPVTRERFGEIVRHVLYCTEQMHLLPAVTVSDEELENNTSSHAFVWMVHSKITLAQRDWAMRFMN